MLTIRYDKSKCCGFFSEPSRIPIKYPQTEIKADILKQKAALLPGS